MNTLNNRLREFDHSMITRIQMIGVQTSMECDCGSIVHFYWSWGARFEWIECYRCGPIIFNDYSFLD